MKWPKGKHNRQYIVGVRIVFRLDILDWGFKCIMTKYLKFIHIGPIMFNFEANYTD